MPPANHREAARARRIAAYLRDEPAGCANCHVMQGHYDAWLA